MGYQVVAAAVDLATVVDSAAVVDWSAVESIPQGIDFVGKAVGFDYLVHFVESEQVSHLILHQHILVL